jgi:hypothetical protein
VRANSSRPKPSISALPSNHRFARFSDEQSEAKCQEAAADLRDVLRTTCNRTSLGLDFVNKNHSVIGTITVRNQRLNGVGFEGA